LGPVLDRTRWGETSEELRREFGGRATLLAPPVDFGDSYADVALRDESLGGYAFTVFFQMDKATRALKRVMFRRQPHGANPRVFAAATAALAHDYGPPAAVCEAPATRQRGYQAATEQIWHLPGSTVRAVFRDTTLEASGGCPGGAGGPCGLVGQLFILIAPPGTSTESCP
jgi:hypothetical protein